jgi:DNA-binding MarR family transcriptional regulator
MDKTFTFPEFGPCYSANLHWIAREVAKFYKKLLKQGDITTKQYTLLSFLKIHGPLSTDDLAQVTHLDRTTLTRNLKLLEKKGFISMFPDKVTSIKQICIANKGMDALNIADPGWEKAQVEFRKRFDNTEWEYFNVILGKLSKING